MEDGCLMDLIDDLENLAKKYEKRMCPAVFVGQSTSFLVQVALSCAPNEKSAMEVLQMGVDNGVNLHRKKDENNG